MSRYLLRLSIAVLSFFIGFFTVWASGYWKNFENFVVEQFSNKPSISASCFDTLNKLDRNKEIEEIKAVYKVVLFGPPEYGFVNKKSEDYYTLFGLNLSGKTNEEKVKDFIAQIQKRIPNIENTTLINFLSKSKVTNSLTGSPIQEVKKLDEKRNGLADYVNCLFSFSNVGFNSDRTQAFVFIESECGNYFDSNYAFLTKQNGKWIINDKIPVHISGSHICQ